MRRSTSVLMYVVLVAGPITTWFDTPFAYAQPAQVEYVIQVAVDALHAKAIAALGPEGAPNLWRMRTEGVYTDHARTDYDSTVTSPNHETEFTGRPVNDFTDQNGVLHQGHLWGENGGNPWYTYRLTFHDTHQGGSAGTGATGSYPNNNLPNKDTYEYVDSVMDVAHGAGLRTGHFANKDRLIMEYESYNGMNDTSHPSVIDYYYYQNSHDAANPVVRANPRADQLMGAWTAQMQSTTPLKYTFLHLDPPDVWGHHSKWDLTPGSDYLFSVQEVDGYIGQLFNVIDNDPRFKDKTAIILTSDHGGVQGTTGHGTKTALDDYEVNLYVWSPTISEASKGAELYLLNPQYANPGTGRPTHNDMSQQPFRNGCAPNLGLQLLGLGPIPNSTWNYTQDIALNWEYSRRVKGDDAAVRYYRLGESGTTTAANSANYPQPDPAAGSGLYAASPLAAPGLVRSDAGNGAVRFDGSQRVTVPNDAEVNNGTFAEKTIELWFKPDAVTGRQMLYQQGDSSRGLNVYIADGKLYLNGWDTGIGNPQPWGGTGANAKAINITVGAGDTHHATLVMRGDPSGTSGSITGYLDGRPFGQVYGAGQLLPHAPAAIGQVTGSTLYHDGASTAPAAYSGVLDDVSMYNKALSLDRVQFHMVQGNGKAFSMGSYGDKILADAPAAYWQLGEVSGNGAVNVATSVNGGVTTGAGSAVDGRHVGGVTVGGASLVPNGDNGAAIYNGIDGGTRIPSHADINAGAAGTTYPLRTVSLWFNASNPTGRQVLYEEGGQNDGLNIYLEGGQLRIGAWTGISGSTPIFANFGTACDSSKAHHVSLTLDSNAKALVGLLDGRVFGANTGMTALPVHANGIGIGRMNDESRFADGSATGVAAIGDGYSLNGAIDDVAVFNQSFSIGNVRNQLAAAGMVVGAADAYEAAVQANSPTAYWRMNEPQGNGTANTSVASTSLGHAVTGTLQSVTRGAASLLPAVPGDAAGTFALPSGTIKTPPNAGNPLGGITVPDNSGVNTSAVKQRTIELWFNANDVAARQVLFEEGGGAAAGVQTGNGLNAYLEGGDLHLGAWRTNSSVTTFDHLSTHVSAGQAYHVVYVFDYDTNSDDSTLTMKGYLNGAPFGSLVPNGTVNSHTADTGIGAMIDGSRFYNSGSTTGDGVRYNGYYFTGRIDEVALYNAPLHIDDVQTHYAAGSGTRLGLTPKATIGAMLNFDAGQATGQTSWNDTIGTRNSSSATFGWTLANAQRVTGTSTYPGITGAYAFNGTTTKGSMASMTTLPGDPTTKDATFEMWVKPSDFSGTHLLFETGGTTDATALTLEGSTLKFMVENGGASGRYGLSSYDLARLPAGQADEFIQIMAQVDITGQRTLLYIDGLLVDQQGIVDLSGGTTKLTDWAGTDGTGLGDVNGTTFVDLVGGGYTPFAGQMAIMRFYDTTLSSQEVWDNWRAVPEPSTWAMLSAALVCLPLLGRRRGKARRVASS